MRMLYPGRFILIDFVDTKFFSAIWAYSFPENSCKVLLRFSWPSLRGLWFNTCQIINCSIAYFRLFPVLCSKSVPTFTLKLLSKLSIASFGSIQISQFCLFNLDSIKSLNYNRIVSCRFESLENRKLHWKMQIFLLWDSTCYLFPQHALQMQQQTKTAAMKTPTKAMSAMNPSLNTHRYCSEKW